MTTNPESLLAVTQEDREAAADYLIAAYPEAVRDPRVWKVREGKNDADPAVQAFARYRLATRPAPPAQPGREEVVEALRPFVEWGASLANHLPDDFQISIKDPGTRLINMGHLRRLIAALAAQPLLARQDNDLRSPEGRRSEANSNGYGTLGVEAENDTGPENRVADSESEEGSNPSAAANNARQDVRPEAEPVACPCCKAPCVVESQSAYSVTLEDENGDYYTEHRLGRKVYRYTEPASVREERLREALEHTRDELVRLAWDENHPLIDRIEAALSTEEPKL